MTSSCKLLCVGDIHLGRTPSRLPDELLEEWGTTRRRLGPAAALERSVTLALDERVDAVLFAGDVVEGEGDFFEAYPRLLEAARRLVAGGVDVVAVAGNHDVRVLPRLADEVPGLTLLGRGGAWESHVVRRDGEAVLRVLGWSFPQRRVPGNPLANYPGAWEARRFEDGAPGGLATVGLLHADLDAGGGVYAPVARAELARRGLAGWLVGHVHRPDREGLSAAAPLGYLGSLCGLDPGEPGAHGPWLGRVEDGRLRLEQVALASVRYQELELPVDALREAQELEPALTRALAGAHARWAHELGRAEVVALRVRAVGERHVGAADLAAVLARAAPSADGPGLRTTHEGVHYLVERALDATRPALDLDTLAAGTDPVGLFARRVLALEAMDQAGRGLVERATRALERSAVLTQASHDGLEDPARDTEAVRRLLLVAARRALGELLEQREPDAPRPPAAAEVGA